MGVQATYRAFPVIRRIETSDGPALWRHGCTYRAFPVIRRIETKFDDKEDAFAFELTGLFQL